MSALNRSDKKTIKTLSNIPNHMKTLENAIYKLFDLNSLNFLYKHIKQKLYVNNISFHKKII